MDLMHAKCGSGTENCRSVFVYDQGGKINRPYGVTLFSTRRDNQDKEKPEAGSPRKTEINRKSSFVQSSEKKFHVDTTTSKRFLKM